MPALTDRAASLSAPCRLGVRSSLLLLVLTGLYVMLTLYFPPLVRYGMLAALALAVLFVCFPRPSAWLLTVPLLVLLGGRNFALGDFFPAYLTVGLFAFFVFYALDRIVWDEPLPALSRPLRLVLAALLLQATSIVASIHLHGQLPINAIREGSGAFMFAPLAFVTADLCRDRDRLLKLSRTWTAVLLVAGLIGVLEYLSITGYSRTDLSLGFVYRGRVASLLGNPNVFAGFLEITAPLALALAFSERSLPWRILGFSATLTAVLSVLYTFSRGGLLAIGIGCGTVLAIRFRRRLWLPALIMAAFAFLLIRNAETFERQMSFFLDPGSQLSQPSLLHRYVTYQGLWHEFSSSPLTGLGWGAREFYWGRTQIYTFWAIRHAASSTPIPTFGGLNSIVLSFAVKGGLVSLAALLLVGTAVLSAFRRSRNRAEFPWGVGIPAGLLGMSVHQLMDNFLQWPQISSVFWMFLGMLVAAGGRRKE